MRTPPSSAMCSALLAVMAAATLAAATPPGRTFDGHPDLSGIWQTMSTANWDLQDHPAQAGLFFQLGAVGAVPSGQGVVEGGTIPYKPEALKQKQENAKNRWKDDPEVKCYMAGIPRANYMPYPFQIVQTPQSILMSYEYASANRVINMSKTPVEASVDTWMGTANGRWEGESLVVDNTGFNDQSWFDRAGDFHSDQLHVTERYTPRSADTMMYEATIEDPKVFSKPFKISMPLYRRVEKNAQVMEYKCVEFAEEVLYGHLRKQPLTGSNK